MNRNPKEFSFDAMDITQIEEEPAETAELDPLQEDFDSSDIRWASEVF